MGNVAPAEHATFRQGAQVLVLPDGTLVLGFYRILFDDSSGTARTEQAILRSFDQGRQWERLDTTVSPFVQTKCFIPASQ